MRITEGISGVWHYHLSADDSPSASLCGATTMPTNMQLSQWRKPFGDHFPKRPTFCDECERLAGIGGQQP